MEGSDFRAANLEKATGLALLGVDLLQARVARASFCGLKVKPIYVDLRDIDARPSKDKELSGESIEGLSDEAKRIIRERSDACKNTTTCIMDKLPNEFAHILYSKEQTGTLMKTWPDLKEGEDAFYNGLAEYLVAQIACKRGETAQLALGLRIKERILVNPNDQGVRKLARRLGQELRNPTCSLPKAFQALPAYLRDVALRESLSDPYRLQQ